MKSFRTIKRIACSTLLCFAAIPALQHANAANVSDYLAYQALNWNDTVINMDPLVAFYESRNGEGIWTNQEGLSANGKRLVKLIQQAEADGLEPKEYLSAFPANVSKISAEALPGVELYFSQAFLGFARDLHSGRTTPAVSEPDIIIKRKEVEPEKWFKRDC